MIQIQINDSDSRQSWINHGLGWYYPVIIQHL